MKMEVRIMPRYCVLYEQHPQSSDAALYKAESQSSDAALYKVYSQSSDAIPEYARFAKIAKPVLYEEKHQNERMNSWGL